MDDDILDCARQAEEATRRLARITIDRPSLTPAEIDVVIASLAGAVAALPRAVTQLGDMLQNAASGWHLAMDSMSGTSDPSIAIDTPASTSTPYAAPPSRSTAISTPPTRTRPTSQLTRGLRQRPQSPHGPRCAQSIANRLRAPARRDAARHADCRGDHRYCERCRGRSPHVRLSHSTFELHHFAQIDATHAHVDR